MNFLEWKKKVNEKLNLEKYDFLPDAEDTLLVGVSDISATQKMVHSITSFRDKKFIDIRTWYQTESGEWKPTKKGIHLAAERIAELEKSIRLFAEALNIADS